ncbi:UPF0538 protein C2orf76 homolog isoform X2 [Stylophora pistillata]|uniref:UPF0538 protein C2orf76 homolog isoform X2 n=1 Tax=Stylophora pistillata TaxID=50429 RepID=UPI000C03E1A9|nr:UPF0538 protein C2orf76 homolog isoform X2 [Stylophora pistillata]
MYEEARAESCGATVTVRLIRSFEYRSIKYVVFKDVSLEQTAEDFMDFVVSDTMKIQHKAHGAKTSDPVINTENDEMLMLRHDCSLSENGIGHETEISFFKKEDYERYKDNPMLKW